MSAIGEGLSTLFVVTDKIAYLQPAEAFLMTITEVEDTTDKKRYTLFVVLDSSNLELITVGIADQSGLLGFNIKRNEKEPSNRRAKQPFVKDPILKEL